MLDIDIDAQIPTSFWTVGGDKTRAYSVKDSLYVNQWNGVTFEIESEIELADYLARRGLIGPILPSATESERVTALELIMEGIIS